MFNNIDSVMKRLVQGIGHLSESDIRNILITLDRRLTELEKRNEELVLHPEVIRWLEARIPSLELESADDPESLMHRALKRQGMLEAVALLRTLTKES